ncbi:MAG: hypothetical protein ACYC4U_15340 [Pirellulaceae bacterium]
MSHACSSRSCHECCGALSRRWFLKSCGVGAGAMAADALWPKTVRSADPVAPAPVRVAAVFLTSMNTNEIWPYPGFDTRGRQEEVLTALRRGCPEIEFRPVTVENPADLSGVTALQDQVQGILLYVMTLDWAQCQTVLAVGQLRKPLLVVDEFLGGCGAFLIACSGLAAEGLPAAAVSTTRLEDVIQVAHVFGELRNPAMTADQFAHRCKAVYRTTFPPRQESQYPEDRLQLTDIGQCLEQFRQASFLIVGAGNAGQEQKFVGATARYVDFEQLQAFYDTVSPDAAAEWADRWIERATPLVEGTYVEPSRATPEALRSAGGVYLATLELLKKHRTDSVTMNCLGGFAAGKLPSYPCLGFMQMLDDGGQGVCEAMPDDSVSMLMARILTGRPGFVSDPALDTSQNQIIYAHCVGTTKVFGPAGAVNPYRIRTLHNRDPRGACVESLLPAGYLTTSFRTNVARQQMVIHRAKSLGSLDSERGCRTKLIGEVCGDIEKLFRHWNQFSWHRVTVFGDVQEPLSEFGRALGLEVIEEA